MHNYHHSAVIRIGPSLTGNFPSIQPISISTSSPQPSSGLTSLARFFTSNQSTMHRQSTINLQPSSGLVRVGLLDVIFYIQPINQAQPVNLAPSAIIRIGPSLTGKFIHSTNQPIHSQSTSSLQTLSGMVPPWHDFLHPTNQPSTANQLTNIF